MNQTRIHWSFWLICIIALIWNAMGCINYIMQLDPESLARYPDAARVLVETRPLWASIGFAVAVFLGLLGDILLILRKASAYYFFNASLFGAIATNIHTFRITEAVDIWAGSIMSMMMAAFLIWYSKFAEHKGWTE